MPRDWLRVYRPRRIGHCGNMVSRYGVTKDGAVGVASMHCLLPHCGGPHHLSPHPQNPAPPMPPHTHNHVHPHNHQPPPPPSPHGHLNHLTHAQHQLTINIGHHQHQNQQTQHSQAPPPQYRIITAAASKSNEEGYCVILTKAFRNLAPLIFGYDLFGSSRF